MATGLQSKSGMRSFLVLFSIFIAFFAWSLSSQAALALAPMDGYVSDVNAERSQKFHEIYIFSTPPPKEKNLHEAIFNQKLSKEFRQKYLDKFGQVDTESIMYQKNNFNTIDSNGTISVSVETEADERKQFAEYMMKRLTEYHVDNYFKNDPTMRPIYQAKEKLSNVEVKVGNQVKLNIRYELAGNTLDLVAKNPWCDARLSLEMDPSAFGPSSMEEARLWLGKDISKKLRVNTNATLYEGMATLEFIRVLTPTVTGLASVSSYFKDGEEVVRQLDTFGAPTVRESRGFVGFSHAF